MIEKIISRINEITISRSEDGIITGCNMGVCEDDDCLKCLKKKIIKIVQEVVKEYGKDTNVRSYEDGYADGWNDCSHTKAYQKGE